MSPADPCALTIAEAAPLIAERRLGIVELTQAFLTRIERLDPVLHAYVTVTAERALEDARVLEGELRAGRYRGPLHGIPIGLKDIYDTAGIPTGCGSHLLASRVPAADSAAAERLRSAGTVLLGKLTTHEFAFGGPSWDLPTPPARNPWNPEHFTGGSSSGSGAAIAAGLAMGTLGSDTGGSIRMPAFFCGIHGLKPTYGRVSRRGVAPLAQSLDHCGPMTWTARDAALMLQAIAGYDSHDPASAAVAVPDYSGLLGHDLGRLRIGVVTGFYDARLGVDDSVSDAMRATVDAFTAMGAVAEEAELPLLEDFHACNMVIMLTEALAVHEHHLRETPELYGEIFRDRLSLAYLLTGLDYVQALRLRRQLAAAVERALERFDVLVTAGGMAPAPRIDAVAKFTVIERPLITSPFNVSGHPVAAVCNGFAPDGLPLGMQIVGPRFGERRLLAIADAYERATPFRERRPPAPA